MLSSLQDTDVPMPEGGQRKVLRKCAYEDDPTLEKIASALMAPRMAVRLQRFSVLRECKRTLQGSSFCSCYLLMNLSARSCVHDAVHGIA